MKIGVSSYSFAQEIKANRMNQKDTVRVAKELGFDAIEFTDLTAPADKTVNDYAKEIRNEAQKYKIEISAYVVGADLASEHAEDEIERVKKCVDIAEILGVKYFRHDVMYNYRNFRSFDAALPTLAKNIKVITDYAECKGIKTMTENHGFICVDSDRLEKLINAVNSPNYGALLDAGNFLCADEEPVKAISRLANLAFLVHMKDFKKINFKDYKNEERCFKTRACNYLQGVSVGSGCVSAEQCVRILQNAGFDGYIDIEYEGIESCIKGVKEGLAFLREVLNH